MTEVASLAGTTWISSPTAQKFFHIIAYLLYHLQFLSTIYKLDNTHF